MKHSFRTKVVATFLLIMFGCMLILILSCEFLLRPMFINDSKKNMIRYAGQVQTALKENDDHIPGLLYRINTEYLIRTTVLDKKREVLFSEAGDSITSSKSTIQLIERIDEYESEQEKEEAYFRERYNRDDQIRRLFYIVKTADGGYIIMNKAIKGIEQDVRLVTVFITIMGLLAAGLGSISWILLTRPFTRQMKKMSRITHAMSQLEFEEKINYESSDEIGLLADSIDGLSDHLKASIEELRADVERRKMLLRSLSHELKTPITTIRGYAENTQIIAGGNEKIQRYCTVMIEECDEIDRLVEGMLEMSRMESSEYVCETEERRSRELFDGLRMKAGMECPQADIVFHCEERMIRCNMILLERAVLNYIKNAVKYGRPGGRIRVDGSTSKDRFVISVTNPGNGIPKEEQSMIWDAFYKKDRSRTRDKSHGLGLTIVHQIALLHGGGVALDSGKEETTFSIWIPAGTCEDQNH